MNINKKITLSLLAGVIISISTIGLTSPTVFAAPTCNDGTTIPAYELRDDREQAFCLSHDGYTAAVVDDPRAQKIYDRLAQAINILSGLMGIVVVVSIIIGGIQYTTSSGDPQKVAAAKSRIINSIFALIAFIFIYAFLQYIVPGGVL